MQFFHTQEINDDDDECIVDDDDDADDADDDADDADDDADDIDNEEEEEDDVENRANKIFPVSMFNIPRLPSEKPILIHFPIIVYVR